MKWKDRIIYEKHDLLPGYHYPYGFCRRHGGVLRFEELEQDCNETAKVIYGLRSRLLAFFFNPLFLLYAALNKMIFQKTVFRAEGRIWETE